MAEWIKSLQGLPVPIAILVVFTGCLVLVIRSVFKRTVDPQIKAHKETTEMLRDGLAENTEAVKDAVKHNARIVENHLAHDKELWMKVQEGLTENTKEMGAVRDSLDTMNNRRREYDPD